MNLNFIKVEMFEGQYKVKHWTQSIKKHSIKKGEIVLVGETIGKKKFKDKYLDEVLITSYGHIVYTFRNDNISELALKIIDSLEKDCNKSIEWRNRVIDNEKRAIERLEKELLKLDEFKKTLMII